MHKFKYPVLLMTICLIILVQSIKAAEPQKDVPFVQEYRGSFIQKKVKDKKNKEDKKHVDGVNDIRDVVAGKDGRVWTTSVEGVFRVESGEFKAFGKEINGPTYEIGINAAGEVWIGAWDGLYKVEGDSVKKEEGLAGPVVNVDFLNNRFFVSTPKGVFEKFNGQWVLIKGPWGTTIRDLKMVDGNIYIASWSGLYSLHGSYNTTGATINDMNSYDQLLSRNMQDMAVDQKGRLWVGSRAGVDVFKNGKRVKSLTPGNGLPSTDVRSISVDANGKIWIGTGIGLARYDEGKWSFLHSLRWLPVDEVHDVSFDKNGNAWVATKNGLSVIKKRTMTLEEKAAYFQKMVRDRHVRPPGLVERCALPEPGNLKSYKPMDTDNDGLFTGLYLASESYRYAATGAPDAKANAIEAYRAMEYLQTVTGSAGFVARTVIPSDWTTMADKNRKYTPQEQADRLARESRWKLLTSHWRKSADGKWLWKGDTSSDEMTGHFFAYPIYYDLVADEKEKKRVAKHVGKIMDYIIDGGYVFKDLDGKSTRWSVWSPEQLNGNPDWWLEKGGNSVEILAYLTTAWHCTKNEKYQKEIEKLLTKHNYAKNILTPMHPGNDYFTYIGYQLLSLSYPALLKYETDPKRLALYKKSMEAWFSVIRKDGSPLYAFVYAKNSDGDARIDDCMEMFRNVSLDMIQWTFDNSKREDIKVVHRPAENRVQTERLLPANERSVFRWDRNVYELVRGNAGRDEGSSVYWLLPYWMGRYEGMISAPK